MKFEVRRILEANGLKIRNKNLLTGPPGCGQEYDRKSISNRIRTAIFCRATGRRYRRLSWTDGQYLRELLRSWKATAVVLLIDELDALGKQRGSYQDVGELDRIVIAMLQELEFFSAEGILIATSNLQKSLDAALWRRFDSCSFIS